MAYSELMNEENPANISFFDEYILPRLDELSEEDFSFQFLSNLSNSLGPIRSTEDDQDKENNFPVVFNKTLSCACPAFLNELSKNNEESIINQDPPNSSLKAFDKHDIFKVALPKEKDMIHPIKIDNLNSRKNSRDSISKKILTHSIKFITDIFNKNLIDNLQRIAFHRDKNFPRKIKNLGKDLKSDVTIVGVKKLLEKNTIEFFKTTSDNPNMVEMANFNNNMKILTLLEKNQNVISNEFNLFLHRTFDEHLLDYFNSHQYVKDKKNILEKQIQENSKYSNCEQLVKKYMKDFEKYGKGSGTSLGFREYFKNSTPNNKRK